MADELDDESDLLLAFGALPTGESDKRETCDRCKRPASTCLCPHLPEKILNVKTNIHILQHPKEESRLLTTVPIIEACVKHEKFQIYRGRRFNKIDFPELYNVLEQPNSLLLYPGPEAVDVKTVDLTLYENYNLIVLDGTWRQARNIFYCNPFLTNIKQVVVEHDTISQYVIRTQPTNKSLSTVEAVALTLSILENDNCIYQAMVNPLKALCQFQLNCGAVVHSSKEEKAKQLTNEISVDGNNCASRKKRRRRRRRERLRHGQVTEEKSEDGLVETRVNLQCIDVVS